MVSIASKAFSIFQRDLLLFATRLVTSILIARILGPPALGIWVILSMVPAYAEAFARTKTDLAAVYFIGKRTFRREDMLLNMNIIALTSAGFIVILILWQLEPLYIWLFSNETGDYRSALQVLILQIPLQFLYLNYSYFHIAEENILVYNRMVVIHAWGNSVTAILLLTLSPLGLWSVIFAVLVGTAGALLYGLYAIDRTDWVRGKPNRKLSFAMLRYGLNFYAAGLLGQLQQSGSNLIALGYIVPAQLAFLAQGQGVGQLLQKVVEPLSTILFPRISRSDGESSIEISCRAFRMSLLLMGIGGIVLALVAEQFIVILYGIEFLPSAGVVIFLLPGIVANGVGGTLSSYFNGTGRAHLIPIIMLVPVTFQLLLAWLLLPLMGLSGAALAISIGLIMYGLALTIVFLKVSKISVGYLIPKLSDIQFIFTFIRSIIRKKLLN